jgi:hypothetical protein
MNAGECPECVNGSLGPPPELPPPSDPQCFLPPPPPTFMRGDANSDGLMDLSDGVYILNYLFMGGASPACYDTADANDNGAIDLTDGIYIFSALFLGGPPVPEPRVCGPDTTEDQPGKPDECVYECSVE